MLVFCYFYIKKSVSLIESRLTALGVWAEELGEWREGANKKKKKKNSWTQTTWKVEEGVGDKWQWKNTTKMNY